VGISIEETNLYRQGMHILPLDAEAFLGKSAFFFD
jgi:hypothetical protein